MWSLARDEIGWSLPLARLHRCGGASHITIIADERASLQFSSRANTCAPFVLPLVVLLALSQLKDLSFYSSMAQWAMPLN